VKEITRMEKSVQEFNDTSLLSKGKDSTARPEKRSMPEVQVPVPAALEEWEWLGGSGEREKKTLVKTQEPCSTTS